MADNWYQGNAAADGDQYRGWLLGHFIDPDAHGIRHTGDLEVKWGLHPAGQTRPGGWTTGETRTSLLMLVTGKWRQEMTRRHLHPRKPRRLHRLGTRHRTHLASRRRQHHADHPLALLNRVGRDRQCRVPTI